MVCTGNIRSAPDDHFAARPDGRVIVPGSRCVSGSRGYPTIRAGIISPAGVKVLLPSSNHPKRSSHCQSRRPCESLGPWARLSELVAVQLSVLGGCISRWCSWSIHPNNHFTAGPHGGVKVSAKGGVGDAGGCPGIIGASGRSIRYCRKSISIGSYNFARG